MPLNPDTILSRLSDWSDEHGAPSRCVVAFSGGRDSTVLLNVIAPLAESLGTTLLAVHVNHGMQAAADDWEHHCQTQASRLGVEFQSIRVDVARQGNDGPEGNARVARYRALEALLGAGDWLMTAHHQDDQAETVLLNLMRGSGVAGVRGIAACRALGRGLLMRPLLNVSAGDIADFAQDNALSWIEDVSNSNLTFDRNYLRGNVLPALVSRWPAASRQLARSADLAAEAALLLDDLAAKDIESCGRADRLAVAAMAALPVARCRNLIRHACRQRHLPLPPSRQLDAIMHDLLPARDDAAPLVSWAGVDVRRYREFLYLMPALADLPDPSGDTLKPGGTLALGGGFGQLRLLRQASGGIAPPIAEAGLQLQFRQGGEVLRPAGRGTRKALKKLLQEEGVLPWMRAQLPLLYAGESLVAVADLWIAEEFFSTDGYSVAWDEKPAVL